MIAFKAKQRPISYSGHTPFFKDLHGDKQWSIGFLFLII